MGGLFSTPKIPKPPAIEPPPRMPVETDPDLKKRADLRLAQQRKGRRSTILAERTAGSIQKSSLGGATGHDYSGVGPAERG